MAEYFKKQFTWSGENTEKYITFTAPIEKKITGINRNREEIKKNIFYILQFIDSKRFMASSLSNLVSNLSKGIHKIKYRYKHDAKKFKNCGIKYKYCNWFF